MAEIYYCNDNQEVVNYLKNNLQNDDVVLLKGSNGMKLKDVVTKIEEKFHGNKNYWFYVGTIK